MSDRCPVTLVIPTRNRRDELHRAISSALIQTIVPEIIVLDDGSVDGTAEMVARDFPQVIFLQFQGAGPCRLRNIGISKAAGEIVVCIDDDAWFDSPSTVEQTVADFETTPLVSAVAIPLINIHQGPAVLQQPPDRDHVYATYTFIGAAHALRRKSFLEVGGYPDFFYYMGEESDLTLRLLDAGFATMLGRGDPIHHSESPRRSSGRADYFGYRNLILLAWRHAPLFWLILSAGRGVLSGVSASVRGRNAFQIFRGLVNGTFYGFSHPRLRKPVSSEGFELFRKMRRVPLPMEELATFLRSRHGS